MATIAFVDTPLTVENRAALEQAARQLPGDWHLWILSTAAPCWLEIRVQGALIQEVFGSPAITKTVVAEDFGDLLLALEELRSAFDVVPPPVSIEPARRQCDASGDHGDRPGATQPL